MVSTTKTRVKISSLLARENGNSIAVVYQDVKTPRKSKYIPYNNMKHLMVYSIIILDFDKWKSLLMDTMSSKKNEKFDRCIQFFRYYDFVPDVEHEWNSNKWIVKN